MPGTGETNTNKIVLVLALGTYSHVGRGQVIGTDNAEECALRWGGGEYPGSAYGVH